MARTTASTDARQATQRVSARGGKILPSDTRLHHRTLVLQHLVDEGPQSRADLARHTKLARVTISDVVAGLIADDLVVELGVRPGTHMGKPATLVGLNATGAYIACLDLSDDDVLRGTLVDLEGTVVVAHDLRLGDSRGDDAVDRVVALCRALVLEAPGRVLGVGVGTPGIVSVDGVVANAPNLGWESLPLSEILGDALGVPAHVANDADTAALAEDTFGHGSGEGLLLVEVGGGVGAGILLDGNLLRGPYGTAGEIGHVIVVPDGPPCTCGRHGCLEALVSVPGLRARTAGLSEAEASGVLSASGRQLGHVLGPVVQALGLRDVVISGPPELLDGPFRQAVEATVRALTRPFAKADVVVRMSALGRDGVLHGAAALVLDGELGIS